MIKNLEDETSLLLFSDEDNMYQEKPYYQALLNKYDHCRSDDLNVKIISSKEKDVVEYLDVKIFNKEKTSKGI
ncbi:hypothetical protein ACE1TI_05065 [Alteribacillus sp. JSM 102045]|uniref:hypothetical protein n=1 Tax=Alteribacillus sp. JSM 102045 TaxID=1562101 RepID=UPI0035C170AC